LTDHEYEQSVEQFTRDSYTGYQNKKRAIKKDLIICKELMMMILEDTLKEQRKVLAQEKKVEMLDEMMQQYEIELGLVSEYDKATANENMAALREVEMVTLKLVQNL